MLYFNNAFFDTARLKVEMARAVRSLAEPSRLHPQTAFSHNMECLPHAHATHTQVNDPGLGRAWSRYTKGSSKHRQLHPEAYQVRSFSKGVICLVQSANASAACVPMLGLQVGAEPAATATSKKASKGKKTGGTKGGAAGAGACAAVEASDAAKSDPRFKVCRGQRQCHA